MKALAKDIFRTIGHEKRRFFSILLITALGVTMLTGLRAACNDLRLSADALFDEQKLFDIQVSSTLGLDNEDVEALRALDAAEIVEGEYAEELFTDVNGVHDTVTVRTLEEEMNLPTVLEGTLPTEDDEVAVTEPYIEDSGKTIGDTLTFAQEASDDGEDEEPVFVETEYTITAVVIDPFDINNRESATSFRAAAAATYTFFVLPSAADTDLYTSVYVYLRDTADLMCYSDEYSRIVQDAKNEINDTLKEERQQARYDKVYGEAMDEYNDAYDEAMEEIDDAQAELDDARQELADTQQQLLSAQQLGMPVDEELQEVEEALVELEDGQAELDENREEALAELADAKAGIEDIEMAKWYIQSRDSLSGYSNVRSDANSIQGLGNFIPLIFFVVAILIALTAIARMVEEDRGLIGTYKALGFKNREIRRKYLVFAVIASILGGILGDFAGFIILPRIIFAFFYSMYYIPSYLLRFEPASGSIGIAMFLVGILLAALYAVHSDLTHMPAMLMRPAAPKSGKRIFLEHIPVFWRRLSFLNKVTARNLFRYKRRLLMTVIGIMGCTALLICGFGIRNTVTDMEPRQYDNVVRYDILAVATDNEKLLSYMDDPKNIESYLNLEVESMTLTTASEETETVQVFVIPDDAPLSDFIKIAYVDGEETDLPAEGVAVTHSIEKVLGVEDGDTVTLQDLSLTEAEIPVAMVTENYLGDMVYVRESCYEEAFGKAFSPNAVLVRLTEACLADDPIAYADALGAKDGIMSVSSTQESIENYSQAFAIMNIVVYVIVVLAAALAFVVLYTLATTNISERERELATIKVLGFFDREVHQYVNKETIILSCIGIALGLPLGWILTYFLCWVLKIPGIFFAASVFPVTYVICAALAVAFTLIVNQITNRILNRIDPVEALKSIE